MIIINKINFDSNKNKIESDLVLPFNFKKKINHFSSLSKFSKIYFNNKFVLDKDLKMKILLCFRKVKFEDISNLNNYILVKKYQRGVSCYDNEFKSDIDFIKRLKNGDLVFTLLSDKAISHINDFCFKKYYENKNKLINNDSYLIDFRINEFIEKYPIELYPTYYDENNTIKDDILNDLLIKRNIKLDKENKLINYAIENEKNELLTYDSNNNLVLSDIAKNDYLYKDYIPLSTKEKIKLSVLRTKREFDKLIFCNCEKFKYFVTLTFAPINEKQKHLKNNDNRLEDDYDLEFDYVDNAKDYDLCVKCLQKFFNAMKMNLKRKNIEFFYIGVPEYQKNGNIHYHFLFSRLPQELLYNVPSWLDIDYKTKKRRFDFALKNWKFGKSTIELIESNTRISSYISKYISKNLYELNESSYFDRLNKKRYYSSNNLTKEIKCDSSDVFNEYDEILDTYSKESYNSFLKSTINTCLYQVKEIDDNSKIKI